MNSDIQCPRCGQPAAERRACRHLRWRPQHGGPIDFAKSLVADPDAPRLVSAEVPDAWWESQYDWLFERITARTDVVQGYCFADPGELDSLRLDIKHRLATSPPVDEPPAPAVSETAKPPEHTSHLQFQR